MRRLTKKEIGRIKDIVLYVLTRFQTEIDFIKLYKILYFANREQLARVGLPIFRDNFKAWQLGPVPHLIGGAIRRMRDGLELTAECEPLREAFIIIKDKRIKPLQKPVVENIPEITRELLDKYFNKYKYKRANELSRESHDEAWREAYYTRGGEIDGRKIIQPYLMAECADGNAETVEQIKVLYTPDNGFINHDAPERIYDPLKRAFDELAEFSELTAGWDGEDGMPVPEQAVINARWILLRDDSALEYLDDVYPTPNGTVVIDWIRDGEKVSVEVSDSQYAFYWQSADKTEAFDSPTVEFSLETLNPIYKYLSRMAGR